MSSWLQILPDLELEVIARHGFDEASDLVAEISATTPIGLTNHP